MKDNSKKIKQFWKYNINPITGFIDKYHVISKSSKSSIRSLNVNNINLKS